MLFVNQQVIRIKRRNREQTYFRRGKLCRQRRQHTDLGQCKRTLYLQRAPSYFRGHSTRNATTAANSSGVPMRPAGISRAQPANTSSGWTCVREEMLVARESSRAVRVYPGQTLFTVIPWAAYSLASVRASPVTAARTELE